MNWLISILIGVIIFLGIVEVTLLCYFIEFIRNLSKEITCAVDEDNEKGE